MGILFISVVVFLLFVFIVHFFLDKPFRYAESAMAGDVRIKLENANYDFDGYPKKIKKNVVYETTRKKYLLGEVFSTVVVLGSSMEKAGMYSGDLVLLDAPDNLETGDIIAIRMPEDHPDYPNKIKLRVFDRFEDSNTSVDDKGRIVHVQKYDDKTGEQIPSDGVHYERFLVGKRAEVIKKDLFEEKILY